MGFRRFFKLLEYINNKREVREIGEPEMSIEDKIEWSNATASILKNMLEDYIKDSIKDGKYIGSADALIKYVDVVHYLEHKKHSLIPPTLEENQKWN